MKATPFSAANSAIEKVYNCLAKIGMPFEPQLQYLGFRAAQYNAQGRLKTAYANVLVTLHTPIDYKLRIEIPVPVTDTQVLDPQFFFCGGQRYELNADNLNSLLFGRQLSTKHLVNLYNNPSIITVPQFADGMFSTMGIPQRRFEGYPGSMNVQAL